MDQKRLKYPVGMQSFPDLRQGGYLYVDKTRFVYEMISSGKYFFLSRPRRFGKSLLLSTIEAYFEGRRELFKGLDLDSLADSWERHPVLRLDLTTGQYDTYEKLEEVLASYIEMWEERYSDGLSKFVPVQLSLRFKRVIEAAYKVTGKRVVILVDEYDKPLLGVQEDPALFDSFLVLLKSVYSTLKSMDSSIEFAMLTGVGRFGKLSVFSDLNNLRDISFVEKFSSVCGITGSELDEYFQEGMERLAEVTETTKEEVREQLRIRYDGYRFTPGCPDIYNPFSLLSTFADEQYGDYWFSTGTPSSLVSKIRRTDMPLHSLIPARIQVSLLKSAPVGSSFLIPSLYQAGYLTIKKEIPENKEFVLDFPNREVKEGFLNCLLESYLKTDAGISGLSISGFVDCLRRGDADGLMSRFQSLFASIGYSENEEGKESHFQNIMQIVLVLLGFYAGVEQRTSDGRMDITVTTARYIYIFELKVGKSASTALKQIHEKQYWLPYLFTGKKIFLIGASFNKKTGRLSEWEIEELKVEKG